MRLECSHISYRYPGAEQTLFSDVSFGMFEPGFNALFGPSGVGKTSIAKIIVGAISDYSGTVETGGIQKMLYTHNQERLPGWSAVGTHIERVTPAGRRPLRDHLVQAFGIADCMGSRFSRLSLGQKNRINLLRYLLQDFQLLIMDESLANVDERTRETILFSMKETFPDILFLYISHNVVEVSKFCKEILVFRGNGRQEQTALVRGQNAREDQPVQRDELQKTMLEMMNAS